MIRSGITFRTTASRWLFLGLLSFSTGINAAEPVPVAKWEFGEEEATPLQPHGGVHRDLPGPRSPEYPDFAPDNTAIKLDGNGAYLSFEDGGVQSKFDFTNGDSITLEAWIQLPELRNGENVYVIGKGRTWSQKFPRHNQNWALRVREMKEKGCISFLFATDPNQPAESNDVWHRWTTKRGFNPGPAWHHIAVSYKFGDPDSVRAWIDGRPEAGTWDMGGPTTEPPVVDDDEVWIGSSMGGADGASLRGSLDSIAIYRELADDKFMKARFRRVGEEPAIEKAPELQPELGEIPGDRVVMTIHEGMPAHDRWLNVTEALPQEVMRLETEAMLLDRLPQRFDPWGIRESWKTSVLVRFAADVHLPAGEHRFLMRTRGLSRLWVDGHLIARGKQVQSSPSGEEQMTPPASPPAPGLRIAEHRQQETFGTFTAGKEGTYRVVLETLVGGKSMRTDPGELLVAVQTPDRKSFQILQGRSAPAPLQLTDSVVESALDRLEKSLQLLDDAHRRRAAASQDEFWKVRHDLARDWAATHPLPAAPKMPSGQNPIDFFLRAKVETALAAHEQGSLEKARKFHQDVLPVLRDNCFRCHGEKVNGGLLLNSLAAAISGGDSGLAAVTPGNLQKSELISRICSDDPDEKMPPGGAGLSAEQIETLKQWVESGAEWPAPPVTPEDVAAAPLLSDSALVRRVYLDTVGMIPSEQEVRDFLEDSHPEKRRVLIDRLLEDERWADHWMSYWQDVLAENPTLINASLNTTGPFRWFLWDALRDDKPFDRLVTELLLLRGSAHEGGSAGFGIAANNDAPFAAKGQIVGSAFLGIELQCARCHDSPYHRTTQKDLYSLAAMFERKSVTVPKSSRVPKEFFEKKQRESLIKVTLKPDEAVAPAWPFADVTGSIDNEELNRFIQDPKDSRQRLAALVTAPMNTRFSEVVVNRIWRRFIGAGIVEPPSDWEGRSASHPELLAWLAREFVTHDYSVKHITRLILTSEMYQRESAGDHQRTTPELRFFTGPDRRRLTAEQLLDSLYAATGKEVDSEELTFDPDGRRPASNRLTLGIPRRAWMFASLANERDRPSLSLPRARANTDLMEAFGWSGSRQNPRTDRETAPGVLQPGVLANSTASVLLTRAVQGSKLAQMAVEAQSPRRLVDSIFLACLSRYPSDGERAELETSLAAGFDERLVPEDQQPELWPRERLPVVTWSNHLRPEANEIALKNEQRAREGLPPDPRLKPQWREVYEDVVWSVINLGEFVWVP